MRWRIRIFCVELALLCLSATACQNEGGPLGYAGADDQQDAAPDAQVMGDTESTRVVTVDASIPNAPGSIGEAGGVHDGAECAFPAGTVLAEVSEALARRKDDLDLRERNLDSREQQLGLLEEEALSAAVNLEKLKKEATSLLARLPAGSLGPSVNVDPTEEGLGGSREGHIPDREERLNRLADTLKGMRAASGAELLSNMEKEADAVEILKRIDTRQAAGLLGSMSAKKAAAMAQRMLDNNVDPAPVPDIPRAGETR